jgi:hypothetical protein
MANLLEHVEKLWYSDHDVTNMDRFLEFARQFYLDTISLGHFGEPINQPEQRVARMANTRILSLLDIPHIGRVHDVNKEEVEMTIKDWQED